MLQQHSRTSLSNVELPLKNVKLIHLHLAVSKFHFLMPTSDNTLTSAKVNIIPETSIKKTGKERS